MDASSSDLEFFDLDDATEEEVEEIRDILSYDGRNRSVELPWELPIPSTENSFQKTDQSTSEPCGTGLPSAITAVADLELPNAPPEVPVAVLRPARVQLDVMPSMEAFLTQIPHMSATSAMGAHYAAPYLVPRTLPYLRAYPPHHVGVPVLTCTMPNAGELTHMPSPYTSFLPIAAPVSAVPQTHLEKSMEPDEEGEIRPKMKASADRQFIRKSRKKPVSSDSYYAPDYGQGSDTHDDAMLVDELSALSIENNRLAAVPCVPVPVPQSTFPVTSGALPVHSYPPGLHPLSYSHISGPQAPPTPVYCVPVFPSPFGRYISSATAPMMMPVGNVTVPSANMHPNGESEYSTTNDGGYDLKSCESLAASTESLGKSSESSVPLESDCEMAPAKSVEEVETVDVRKVESTPNVLSDNCSPKSSETVTESCLQRNSKVSKTDDRVDKVMRKAYVDGSRCWADLFKKQCTEINGVDLRHSGSADRSALNEPKLEKDLTNGKMFNVPL